MTDEEQELRRQVQVFLKTFAHWFNSVLAPALAHMAKLVVDVMLAVENGTRALCTRGAAT